MVYLRRCPEYIKIKRHSRKNKLRIPPPMLAGCDGKVINMGKGNRSRQDRALETVKNTQEATPKSTKIKTIVATSVVAFLIVGCILLSVIVNTGIVLRTKSAAKTDNFDVSGTVMSYLIYQQAQSLAYTYQQWGMETSVADIISQFGIEYFSASVLEQVKQMLVLCEYAKANGIELSEEDKTDIEEYIASIEEAAASNLYSTNAYVKLMYGNGVNVSDIREALELNYLSNAAYEKLQETLKGQITDELTAKYIEENPEQFYMVDYLTYTFTAALEAEGAEPTDDEKKAYEDEKAEMAALAATLEAAKSADEFNTIVVDYIVSNSISELFDEIYEDDYKETLETEPEASVLEADKAKLLKEVTDHLNTLYKEATSDEEVKAEEETKEEGEKTAYEEALDDILEEIITEAEEIYNSVLKVEYPHYAIPAEGEEDKTSELDKWLFNADTKAGATKLTKNEGDEKSTYTVSMLMTESHVVNDPSTYAVAHILVKFELDEGKKEPTLQQKEAAKAEAQAILDQYLAGEKTQEAFVALGEEKTDDSNVVYTGAYEGQMVEPFEKWGLDASRQAGDTEIVETEYGYHVMYFIDNHTASENGVLSELFTEWVETEAANHNYSYKQSVIDSIK